MVRRAILTPILCATLLLPACHLGLAAHDSVSERGGVLYFDDVPLEYHREVSVTSDEALDGLRLTTHTGNIDVTGVSGGSFELTVDLYSEVEGDGEVELVNGSLRKHSQHGGRLLINGIRGTLPAGVELQAHSGTGRIVLRDLRGDADLVVETGTGLVALQGCVRGTIRISSGTGDLRLDGTTAELLRVSTGTGQLMAENCTFGGVEGESGTGDFSFVGCQVDEVTVRSGTGDVRITDTHMGRFSPSLGTGDVVMKAAKGP